VGQVPHEIYKNLPSNKKYPLSLSEYKQKSGEKPHKKRITKEKIYGRFNDNKGFCGGRRILRYSSAAH
jgi:hypothetical protein